MLIKDSKEQASVEIQGGYAGKKTLPDVPAEIGMEETIRILTTNPHEKIELTDAQKKAEQKFFRTIDAAAKGMEGTSDASENHDKYIYGHRQN